MAPPAASVQLDCQAYKWTIPDFAEVIGKDEGQLKGEWMELVESESFTVLMNPDASLNLNSGNEPGRTGAAGRIPVGMSLTLLSLYSNSAYNDQQYVHLKIALQPGSPRALRHKVRETARYWFKNSFQSATSTTYYSIKPGSIGVPVRIAREFGGRPGGSLEIMVTLDGVHPAAFANSTIPGGPSLKSLFDSKKFSDFTIVTLDGKRISVHKCVLASQSPVFDGMFQSCMIENQESQLIISDFSPNSVERFVRYLYGCGLSTDLQLSAHDLLAMADKYGVLPLKNRAEKFLCQMIDPGVVCERLLLAHLHQATQLLETCFQFVVANKLEVSGTEEWQALREKFPALTAAVQAKDDWMDRAVKKEPVDSVDVEPRPSSA